MTRLASLVCCVGVVMLVGACGTEPSSQTSTATSSSSPRSASAPQPPALTAFVGTWNNYFLPLIVLRSQEYQPITVGLATWYQLAQQGGGGGQVLFSIVITGALVSIIPVIVVFLLLQRFWQGGLTAGAVK